MTVRALLAAAPQREAGCLLRKSIYLLGEGPALLQALLRPLGLHSKEF